MGTGIDFSFDVSQRGESVPTRLRAAYGTGEGVERFAMQGM